MSAKPFRIYELYDGGGGPSVLTRMYGRFSKQIWHVVAKSVKQAYWCVHNDCWTTNTEIKGIIEKLEDDGRWHSLHESYWQQKFQHRQVFKA